jgi:hypothetical protein
MVPIILEGLKNSTILGLLYLKPQKRAWAGTGTDYGVT